MKITRWVLSLALAACGGGGEAPPSTIGGTWDASGMVVGSTLTMTLTEQDSKVAGVGTYRLEAGRSGAIAIAGSHQGWSAALELVYDNGTKASYAANLQDAAHMSGLLVFEGGGASNVQFARQ
jgi:hypothetical protein